MKKIYPLIIFTLISTCFFSCKKKEKEVTVFDITKMYNTTWRVNISWPNVSDKPTSLIVKFYENNTTSWYGVFKAAEDKLEWYAYNDLSYSYYNAYFVKFTGTLTDDNNMSGECSSFKQSNNSPIADGGSWTASKITFEQGTYTDTRDGQNYMTMKIGTQTWMLRNLNYYTAIGSKYYNNDSILNHVYGRLYTLEAAMQACPIGWHLPTDTEWQTLIDYVGGEDIAAKELKEIGTTHWSSQNTKVTNLTNFSALPAGIYTYNFANLGGEAFFWTATSTSSANANCIKLTYAGYPTYKMEQDKAFFLSVRCVMD